MRAAVIALLAGCSAGDVEARIFSPSDSSFGSTSVTFTNPDGSEAPATLDKSAPGYWLATARLDAGGTVSRGETSSFTPTSHSTSSVSVRGVQPGEQLDFGGGSVPLPPDCRVLATTAPRWTGTSVTWTVSEPGTPTLRSITLARDEVTPGGVHWRTTIFDGETAEELGGSGPVQPAPTTMEVTIVSCLDTTYDDLREQADNLALR